MATKEKVQLHRSAVLALMHFFQWNGAAQWNNEKLSRKLKDLPDVMEAGKEPEDEDVQNTLLTVLAGCEAGTDFEVIDDPKRKRAAAEAEDDEDEDESDEEADEDSDEDEDEDLDEDSDEVDEDDDAADADEDEVDEDEGEEDVAPESEDPAPPRERKRKKTKAKEKPAAVKPKAKKKAAAAKAKPATERKARSGRSGVRPTASRIYHAAKVLKRHGLKKGVTDALVAEVEAKMSKKNEKESRYWLKCAWHALNGYTGEFKPVVASDD